MRHLLKKVLEFILKPFSENFSFLVTMTLLIGVVDVTFWAISGNIAHAFLKGMHVYIMCYCISIVGLLFNNRFIYNTIFISLGIVNFIIDASLRITCKVGFTDDLVAIIMGTNVNESIEFLQAYMSIELMLVIFVLFFTMLFIYRYKNYIAIKSTRMKKILAIFTLFSSVVILNYDLAYNKMHYWNGMFLNKLIPFFTYDAPPDLRDYLSNPIVKVSSDIPDNIVIIIGESLSKSHSTLFGYHKPTTPNLCKMAQDSLLFAYTNVTAPATSTIPAFQGIMSYYSPKDSSSKKWYEYVTLLEVMRLAGYNTYWISNQSPTGVYDNIVAKYAELCDSVIWVGSKYEGTSKRNYDGKIVEELNRHEKMLDAKIKKFIIIHLMGSHFEYEFRYPHEFEKFTVSDYPEYEEHQRKRIAHYDNSVYYNDYVVSELISLFSEKETILFYFPDHGQDLYETYKDHCGHALIDNAESVQVALQIPFYVSCSKLFKNHFQQETKKIISNVKMPLCTDNMMEMLFALFDISVTESNNGFVKR